MSVETITKSSADVILEVERVFGDESGTQITRSDIIRWINNAQLEVVMRNPEVGRATVMVNSVAGQGDYPVALNVPNLLRIISIHYNGRYVRNMPFQEAEAYLQDAGTADPTAEPLFWYEFAGLVTFYPAPAQSIAQGIKIYFNKKPDTITSDSQLLSLSDNYYNSIVSYCLKTANLLDENPQMAGVFAAEFDTGVTRMAERTQPQQDYYPFITIIED